MAGGYLPFGFAPSGELTSYTPTLRERATDWLRTKLFSDDRAGQDKAKRVMDVVGVTPFGFALDTYDAGREAGIGNYGTAGVMLGMAGLPGPSPKKIRAFHGSPHDFDRFSMDKIGTGEGAQAYGHGLYFAENEGVAKEYRDALAKSRNVDGAINAAWEKAAEWSDKMKAATSDTEFLAAKKEYEAAVNAAKNTAPSNPGSMYEVEINADPEAFLDWDKPLSEQPEALKPIAEDILANPGRAAGYVVDHDKFPVSGGNMYNAIASKFGGPDVAMSRLKEAGIPGIRYLDAGSRGFGEGTRNYVVFDDNLINIVRKYGIAGASAMLGYNILDGMDEAQAAELKSIEGK